MKFELNKITMVDFKGIKKQEIDFTHFTQICGQNGIGKTTIATAFYWLFMDKDYELKSNPNVAPNDGRECKPTVIIDGIVDDKLIQLAKIQTIKKKADEDTGIETLKTTNSYEINSVPKSEKLFKEYLQDLNFDYENLMYLIHPYTFMNNKTADLRSYLFGMTKSKSDLEVAKLINAAELVELLKSYKLDEITAMKDKELRVINEEHGKEGELTRSKIEGLELARVVVDTSAKEKELEETKKKIAEVENKKNNANKAVDDLMEQSMKLQFDINAVKIELNKEIQKTVQENDSKLFEANQKLNALKNEIKLKESNHDYLEKQYKKDFDCKEELKIEFKKLKDSTFDEKPYEYVKAEFGESDTVCSMCGQLLPKDKIEAIRSEYEARELSKEQSLKDRLEKDKKQFDDSRKSSLLNVTNEGKALQEKCKTTLEKIETIKSEIVELNKKVNDQEKEVEKVKREIASSTTEIEYTYHDEYNKPKKQLDEIEKQIAAAKEGNTGLFEIELQELRNKSDTLIAEIASADNSKAVDKQIEELKEKAKNYEQKRAAAEKIKKQIKNVNKKKNEMLTEEINAHFSVVKWVLFEMQKNGEYKDACYFEIDGFKYKESTNTGREIQGVLDIVYSLQKYYNSYYPVFLDNAAEINDFNVPKNDQTQLITLNVTEDKEMVIK